MTVMAYHLNFTAPLHPGIEGIGQERVEHTIRSDTLWGALAQCWSLLYPESPQTLAQTCPFTVSSCFPTIAGRRYYPLPLGALDQFFSADNGPDNKELKRVTYLVESLLFSYLSGTDIGPTDLKTHGNFFPQLAGVEVEEPGQQPLDYLKTNQIPHLQVSRSTGGAEAGYFFYASDLYFDQSTGGGLFFLAQCDEAFRSRFEGALRLLGDTGLGADRSIGRGTFSFTSTPVTFPEIEQPNRFLLLSLLFPTVAEIEADLLRNADYHLVRRSGFAAAPGVAGKRRPDLWMLAEGSVLSQPINGDIPEVIGLDAGGAHAVYRYGRGFSVPCSIVKKG